MTLVGDSQFFYVVIAREAGWGFEGPPNFSLLGRKAAAPAGSRPGLQSQGGLWPAQALFCSRLSRSAKSTSKTVARSTRVDRAWISGLTPRRTEE